MEQENQTSFSGWAKVEVMGHQSHIGLCQTEAYGAVVLFRVDQPEIPEREETITSERFVGGRFYPPGTVVKFAAIPAVSVLIGAGSIYRIIPCTQEVALKAIVEGQRQPLSVVKIGEDRSLSASSENSNDDEPGDLEYKDEDEDEDDDLV